MECKREYKGSYLCVIASCERKVKKLRVGAMIARSVRCMKKSFHLLADWGNRKVFVGRDPRNVPPRSVVVFPLMAATLFCGLAGILTVAQERRREPRSIAADLSTAAISITVSGLGEVLNGSVTLDGYLGGADVQETVARLLRQLKCTATFEKLSQDAESLILLEDMCRSLREFAACEEKMIDESAERFSTDQIEGINGRFIALKDLVWALDRDILSAFSRVKNLRKKNRSSRAGEGELGRYRKIDLLLNTLDRIEVRGRDSAGIEILLGFDTFDDWNEYVDALRKGRLLKEFEGRSAPGDLVDGSIRFALDASHTRPPLITFTYKTASITGELGENTRCLRKALSSDAVLNHLLPRASGPEMFMAHTRWASVGSITIENCHPLNNHIVSPAAGESAHCRNYPCYGSGNWTVDVALNGDIDNYSALRKAFEDEGRGKIDRAVSTDTKIIPLQIERYLLRGMRLDEAFRHAVNDFEGSHAIAMQSTLEPGRVFLALRGSGQSLYVGLCDDQFIYSSEVYGLVELTSEFIKIDGETERIPGDPSTKGQIFILNNRAARTEGIEACYYDGFHLSIDERLLQKAEITTRDIDRNNHPHYLLKEILEAPLSMKKTLRGKYRFEQGIKGMSAVSFNLGNDIITPALKNALKEGTIKNVYVIGQGTAAVAGAAIAEALALYLKEGFLRVEAMRASELSGFLLERDLRDTLVIAVTQSGTTTDTNRAVAMARRRGAHLIAIVNRRQSDITHMVSGVFYTSDGRDIEMSVASTKAFYSQVVAGYVLALYFARSLGTVTDEFATRKLAGLERCPELMNRVIAQRETIRNAAWESVKRKRYWAVVGSGPNKVASDEVRIKLSELCYKTISSDIVEDKKHIDLSSEPLILVLAAGNPEPVMGDIVKDVAIFKAHASSVVVVTEEGEKRFDGIADAVIPVPSSDYPATVILNTLAGHLWGYYAACSINEEATILREFRSALVRQVQDMEAKGYSLFEKTDDPDFHRTIEDFSSLFHGRKNNGFFASLSADIAADIALLLKYVTGKLPLEEFRNDFKEKRVSSSPLDMLDITLGRAIDELVRPIDAIRHQAKTVTVGTSRKEEIPEGIIFDFMRTMGISLENLTGRNGIALGRIQKAVTGIRGYTLYAIENLDFEGKPQESSTITIMKRGGISLTMTSRIEKSGDLMGTKRAIVSTGEMYAGLGKSDGASFVMAPLIGEGGVIERVLLIHVHFNEHLTVDEKRDIIGDKFNRIKDFVTEYNVAWQDAFVSDCAVATLLGESADVIARKIVGTDGTGLSAGKGH